jgi:hypothetical protein
MTAEDAKAERLGALINAIVAGVPRGVKLVTPEEEEKNLRETTESSRKRVEGLLEAVIEAKILSEVTGRPAQLEHAQLMQLARILANILNDLDGTNKRTAGRPARDHRLIVIDFLLRKQASPRAALKILHANVATDWGTTALNVKKLITENSRPAHALLQKIGAESAAKTVETAVQFLKRYRNRS